MLRLLRGDPLETLSRKFGVEAHRLAAWRDDLLAGGKEALKGQRAGPVAGWSAPAAGRAQDRVANDGERGPSGGGRERLLCSQAWT